jgi:phospholipase C
MKGFLQDYYARYMLTWQGLDILWTYTPKQLPVINGLARNFAVSDRWFCSVPTQTNPNRAYSICGTSLGRESNMNLTAIEQFDAPTVFNCLGAAGKSWGLYSSGTWVQGKSYTEYTFPQISQAGHGEIGDIAKFFAHASAGSLPQFTYLEPAWGGGKGAFYKQGTDYHPPTHLAPGEQFLAKVYQAVRNGPQWGQTLLIVTFDEHGGTYDHVAPPWGATNPDGHNGADGFKFDLFGARVPTLLVSPFVQPGTVFRAPAGSTVPFDHTSFIKTLLLWAGVDPASAQLGRRMPLAPTFEGVLEDQPVNTASLELKEAPPLLASAAPASPSDAVAAVVQPLDALFTGVGAAAVRAILGRNQGLAGIQADLQRYRQDPEEFETSLGAGVHTFRAGV